jgi:type VI secretion system protein ImpA
MATPEETIDFELLLAPIDGDEPSGESLRYAPVWDQIREARSSDDDTTAWSTEPKVANWPKVVSLTTDALATKSKDIQIAAWLGEALVRIHGFAGLRDGLKLVRLLVDRYWDTLFPEVEDGDLEARVLVLEWLDGALPLPVKQVPITRSPAGSRFSYLHFEQSREFLIPESVGDLDFDEQRAVEAMKQQAQEEGKITSEEWRNSKSATPVGVFEAAYYVLEECWSELEALDRTVDERFGRDAPGLRGLKKVVDDVRSTVESIAREKGGLVAPSEAGDDGTPLVEDYEARERAPERYAAGSGPVHSRDEAFRRLREVAEYFRKTEPHNPVYYLVERAIRWGQMPLDKWLEDVVKDAGVLDQVRETLGLTTTDTSEEY